MKKGSLILALLLYLLALGALATLFREEKDIKKEPSATDSEPFNGGFYGVPIEGIDLNQTDIFF